MASQRALNRIYRHQTSILNKHIREHALEIEQRTQAIKLVEEEIHNYDELILQFEHNVQVEHQVQLEQFENELIQLGKEQRIINERIKMTRLVVTDLQKHNTTLNTLKTKRKSLIEQKNKLNEELVLLTSNKKVLSTV